MWRRWQSPIWRTRSSTRVFWCCSKIWFDFSPATMTPSSTSSVRCYHLSFWSSFGAYATKASVPTSHEKLEKVHQRDTNPPYGGGAVKIVCNIIVPLFKGWQRCRRCIKIVIVDTIWSTTVRCRQHSQSICHRLCRPTTRDTQMPLYHAWVVWHFPQMILQKCSKMQHIFACNGLPWGWQYLWHLGNK